MTPSPNLRRALRNARGVVVNPPSRRAGQELLVRLIRRNMTYPSPVLKMLIRYLQRRVSARGEYDELQKRLSKASPSRMAPKLAELRRSFDARGKQSIDAWFEEQLKHNNIDNILTVLDEKGKTGAVIRYIRKHHAEFGR